MTSRRMCDGRREQCDALTVVGAGWIGRSLSERFGLAPVPRRTFSSDDIPSGSTVIVASGRPVVSAAEALAPQLRAELCHLRDVLDACERAAARRVVVVGSSDVAGAAELVDGTTPQAPLTRYAEVKAALEDECLLRSRSGMPVTNVRLAPVHGPGKARTAMLLRLVRWPVVPVPGGGWHSIGFVLLDDALRAIEWLVRNPAPALVAVGAGRTPLRDLLWHLAAAQGGRTRFVSVPSYPAALRKAAQLPLPEPCHWLLRLSLPRAVAMGPPVPVTPLPEAAAKLVASC